MMFDRAVVLTPIREGIEFKDVPKGSADYEVVQKVYRAGIFDGKGNGEFGVRDNLTRAQMAKVLVDAFNLAPSTTGNIFNDVSETHWAKDYIASMYENGITVGSSAGKYKPNDAVSRAQYAVFLHRALAQDGMIFPED